MAARRSILLRLDPKLHDALRRWAADELRSVNGQIEYLLGRALHQAGRVREPESPASAPRDAEAAADAAGVVAPAAAPSQRPRRRA